jgi:predicted dinucleotide-binding enzyme
MNIGIIGSGSMGSSLATKLVKLRHNVSIANSRGPDSLKQFADDIGARASTVEDAVKNKNVVIVSIPQKNIPDLEKKFFARLPGETVVIDTGNYYPGLRDGTIYALEESGIDSLWVQEQLGVPVIKAFNSILAESILHLGKPKGVDDRVALAVSGDDRRAKQIIFTLADELGFDPFDVGPIGQSWKQQPGSPVYCRHINLKELERRLAGLEATWSENMRDLIIGKRNSDELLMRADYPAYLRTLQ